MGEVMEEKIYLKAYLYQNLGDDLFIKAITDRYDANFIAYATIKYPKGMFTGMKLISGVVIKILRKCSYLFLKRNIVEEYLKKKCKKMIVIGGSLFVENNPNYKNVLQKEYGNVDEFYMIGLNFGPYQTNEYLEYVKNHVFSKATDICFRDQYSYQLFQDKKQVRYASDIVFSLDTTDIPKRNDKKVVISVMDCRRGIKDVDVVAYENKIKEMIEFFVSKEYEVVLMSFCKVDGDEEAVHAIYSKCQESVQKKVTKFFYRGNMKEALEQIATASIVVGSRFHANVLGLLFQKTVIAMSYNYKTTHFLEDIGFQGLMIPLQEIEKFQVQKLTPEVLHYKLDIEPYIENSQLQFKQIDKILKRRKNESKDTLL